MTGRDGEESKGKPRSGYRVGYGKPPVRTQFVKGISGNPKGRPRGSKNKPVELRAGLFREIFLREASRALPGPQGAGLTMMQAAVRRVLFDAASGRPRAQELALRQMAQISQADEVLDTEFTKTMIEAKVRGESELERRERFGLTDEPDLVPHPDDISIDLETGNVTVRGLYCKEDRRIYAQMRAKAKILREGLASVTEMIAREKSAERRKDLKQLRAAAQAKLDEVESALSF